MKKTTLYLDEGTDLALKQIARSRRSSQAELIRQALAQFVVSAETPQPIGIGAYRSGRNDVAERAEELLREAARGRRS